MKRKTSLLEVILTNLYRYTDETTDKVNIIAMK